MLNPLKITGQLLLLISNLRLFPRKVDRLALVATRIISPNQYGFVQGRQIQDCIGIASEAINMISKKVRGGNVDYKYNIHKVFDTLSWIFFLLVLTRFGFHPSFVGWISTILR